MKKKLLFLISQLYKGGAEVSLVNLLNSLDKSKYEIDLMIMNQCPVKNASSLIEKVCDEVNIINVWKAQKWLSPISKVKAHFLLAESDRLCDPDSALLYVRKRQYDWAFHVGEYWPCEFIAKKVNATHKALWMHTDINALNNFDESYFNKLEKFDSVIFVSKNSMEASCQKFKFLSDKAAVIYNINDKHSICKKAEEKLDKWHPQWNSKPVILTVANIRPEKNHLRQIEAMHKLKQQGIDFYWLNIGSTADTGLCNILREKIEEYDLKSNFLLLGPQENPYNYMKKADFVACLSNYESWSMVITEAKMLGKAVIATKTSGAIEQIEDLKTGYLCNFSVDDIANTIKSALLNHQLHREIENNIKNFDNTKEILTQFDELLISVEARSKNTPHDLLYIIDDINYVSGAHTATKMQIKELLRENHHITIFSNSRPSHAIRNDLIGAHFLSWSDFPEDQLYNRKILDCLTDPFLSKEYKQFRWKVSWDRKIKRCHNVFQKLVFPNLAKIFSKYKTICIMSEASAYRQLVSDLQGPRKIQWIHTDYVAWKDLTEWTKEITKHDGILYQSFDKIVVLSTNIEKSMLELYPNLAGKITVNANLMPSEDIKRKASINDKQKEGLKFVTVGRIDNYSKAFDRLYRILKRLISEGYKFHWTIVGDGEHFPSVQKMFAEEDIRGYVTMTGAKKNPFPYVKDADVFALLSRYEGLPNTIYEALILETPVIATNVGGISFQITEGKTGWLVENDENSIYQGLKQILSNPKEVEQIKENLKQYEYDNKSILHNAELILYGEDAVSYIGNMESQD